MVSNLKYLNDRLFHEFTNILNNGEIIPSTINIESCYLCYAIGYNLGEEDFEKFRDEYKKDYMRHYFRCILNFGVRNGLIEEEKAQKVFEMANYRNKIRKGDYKAFKQLKEEARKYIFNYSTSFANS